MSWTTWLAVALLGGVGAVGRFALDGLVSERAKGQLPLGTLVVNLTGAFVLGLLVGRSPGGRILLLAGTAALGSYTTFSTWMLETHRLGQDGEPRVAWGNLALSMLAGIAAAALGRLIGGHL